MLLHTGIHAKTRNGVTFDALFAEADSDHQTRRETF